MSESADRAAAPAPAAPTTTDLAHERTDLAVLRSYMAAERTLMAWIRTTLSMISFGFTLAKLGQAMHDIEVRKLLGGIQIVGVRRIGYFLVVLGTVALFGATLQFWLEIRQLRKAGLPNRFSISLIVAVVLVLLGGFAFTSLVANF